MLKDKLKIGKDNVDFLHYLMVKIYDQKKVDIKTQHPLFHKEGIFNEALDLIREMHPKYQKLIEQTLSENESFEIVTNYFILLNCLEVVVAKTSEDEVMINGLYGNFKNISSSQAFSELIKAKNNLDENFAKLR